LKTIGIVSTGLIGASWTACFLNAGFDVHAWDPADDAEQQLRDSVATALADLDAFGTSHSPSVGDLVFCESIKAAVTNVDYVQENGPERLDLKQALIAEIDTHAPPHALIGSSTSSFLASDLQSQCKNPERVLVAHPFNPPHLLPLVEIVGGDKTSEATLTAAETFFTQIGKHPVRVRKETTGHIANRLTAALFREAVHMVSEGIATVEDIDDAVRYGPGPRWAIHGPFMLYHLGGGDGGIQSYLDHLGPTQEARWRELGSPQLSDAVKTAIIEGVSREVAGRSMDDLKSKRDEALIEILKTTCSIPEI